MQYPSLLPAVKKLLVETVDMPVPTNQFSENKKNRKSMKSETSILWLL